MKSDPFMPDSPATAQTMEEFRRFLDRGKQRADKDKARLAYLRRLDKHFGLQDSRRATYNGQLKALPDDIPQTVVGRIAARLEKATSPTVNMA